MRKSEILVAAIGVVAFSFVGLGAIMLANAPELSAPPAKPKEANPGYDRDDLRSKVIGKTPAEVRQVLGEPSCIMFAPDGNPHWMYIGKTVDPVSGVPDLALILHFLADLVYDVTF